MFLTHFRCFNETKNKLFCHYFPFNIENSNPEEIEEFFGEIRMMKSLPKHQNIIGLIGYCTTKKPVLMVMEFCNAGDLVRFFSRIP